MQWREQFCLGFWLLEQKWACAFRAKDDASIFFSGPVKAEGGTSVAAPAGWLFWFSWRIHSLVKKTLHRHRAGFELQRESSFMKRMKASQILGEAAHA